MGILVSYVGLFTATHNAKEQETGDTNKWVDLFHLSPSPNLVSALTLLFFGRLFLSSITFIFHSFLFVASLSLYVSKHQTNKVQMIVANCGKIVVVGLWEMRIWLAVWMNGCLW